MTIYGFDKVNGIFNVIFFDAYRGQVVVEIKYDALYKAVINVKDYYLSGGTEEALRTTVCCCAYVQTIKGIFHLDVLVGQLKNYICSHNDSINEWFNLSRKGVYDNNNIVFGINVYLQLIRRLKLQINGKTIVPYKSIHDFIKHKKYFLDRLIYIKDNYEVDDDFNILIQETLKIFKLLESIRLLNIKLQLKKGLPPQSLCKDEIYINKLISALETAYDVEMKLIPKIIKSLSLLKYEKGYLNKHYVISLISPTINTDEKYLEFNLEHSKEAYRIDIIGNSHYKYISEPEYIVVNNNVTYYIESNGQNNLCVRTVNIFCDSVKNIKLYTNIDNADYSVNVFCMPSICENADVAELKINERWCVFNQITNIHYNNGIVFDVIDKDPYKIRWLIKSGRLRSYAVGTRDIIVMESFDDESLLTQESREGCNFTQGIKLSEQYGELLSKTTQSYSCTRKR